VGKAEKSEMWMRWAINRGERWKGDKDTIGVEDRKKGELSDNRSGLCF
jgi:hypothetical protein